MDVVINSECNAIPEERKPLVTRKEMHCLIFCFVLVMMPTDPPLADLLRRYHNLDGDWLVLSPVHWQATHNDAMIVAAR